MSEAHEKPSEASEAGVGDIVVVPYPRVREQLKCAADTALLMEDRRNVARLWFPRNDHNLWVDRVHLERVDEGRIASHPLVPRIHRLARLVDAERLDALEPEGEVGHFLIYSPGLDAPQVDTFRELVGEDLVSLRIEAGSVRRVRLVLRMRLPEEG